MVVNEEYEKQWYKLIQIMYQIHRNTSWPAAAINMSYLYLYTQNPDTCL